MSNYFDTPITSRATTGYNVEITLPHYALHSRSRGWVLGTFGLTREQAQLRLVDRKANGDASRDERVRRMRATITLRQDLTFTGYLRPIDIAR